MATNATWTIVFDDKTVINQSVMNVDGNPQSYKIETRTVTSKSKIKIPTVPAGGFAISIFPN